VRGSGSVYVCTRKGEGGRKKEKEKERERERKRVCLREGVRGEEEDRKTEGECM
jgi:hypothetical protein